ncbi:hypothetical protein EV193_11515 [Herbihabitans rhizosphaerae]|uniref:Uncharacterized protein n=1 Tax=Herbihabitans rhizosphaerae TaxID=1872711 RepID=A0A4Q7KDD2_9PSEU|nr:hypothetical protein [Herbihabitans rhizosphaerae]RZS31136.1 hypothetical protein EV193_11515 [Herbihabitans rhizosphaerae]
MVAPGWLINSENVGQPVISARTAGTQVRNILVELDFANRAQVAGWLTQAHTATTPASPSSGTAPLHCPADRLPADQLEQAVLTSLIDTLARSDLIEQGLASTASEVDDQCTT